MHSTCVNSQCSKPILPLHEGRLFPVETGPVAEPLDLNSRTLLLRGNLRSAWNTSGCGTSSVFLDYSSGANAGIALFPLRQTRVSRKGETADSTREASRARPASTPMLRRRRRRGALWRARAEDDEE